MIIIIIMMITMGDARFCAAEVAILKESCISRNQ